MSDKTRFVNPRKDRELEEWIDLELGFYVKGLINAGDYHILRRNLIRIAQAERRRVVNRRRVMA